MGSELLTLPKEGDEGKPNPPLSYTEIFEKQFPHYLAIGMTANEYWHGDNQLPKAYREADRIRFDRKNYEMWVQGKYIYDAVSALFPLLNPMSKQNEPYPYVDEPYRFARNSKEMQDIQAEKEQKQDKAEQEKIKQMLLNFKKAKKGGDDSGG